MLRGGPLLPNPRALGPAALKSATAAAWNRRGRNAVHRYLFPEEALLPHDATVVAYLRRRLLLSHSRSSQRGGGDGSFNLIRSSRSYKSSAGEGSDISAFSGAATRNTRVNLIDATAASSNDGDDDDSRSNKNNTSKSTKSSSLGLIKAYSDLAKAKLSALVVTTTAAGFVAGSTAAAEAAAQSMASSLSSPSSSLPFSDPQMAALLVPCLLGTFLCSASASAVNQIVERSRDAQMKRTQARPLVTKSLSVQQAKVAAFSWGVAGTSILFCFTDPTTAALGAGNWFLYSVIYTSMKPRSVANTWVGAVVGAVPPVMGYSAATSGVLGLTDLKDHLAGLLLLADGGCGAASAAAGAIAGAAVPSWVLLAAGLYWWQLPHFFALSYMHRKDYARGGFRMISGTAQDAHGDWTARCVTRYTLYMATLPLVATALGMTTSMFAMEGMVLNAFALRAAYKFDRDRSNANARKVFLTSLWYLPCWLMLFLLHSKAWDEHKEVAEAAAGSDECDETTVMARLTASVRAIRSKGREMCLHEAWATAPANTLDAERGNRNPSGGGATTTPAAGTAAARRPEACPIVFGSQTTRRGVEAVRTAAADASTATATAVFPMVVAAVDADDGDDSSAAPGAPPGAKSRASPPNT